MSTHLSFKQAQEQAKPGEPLATLLDWVTSYPMNGHAELGRTGMVCPFVKQSSRLDALALSICDAGPDEEDRVFKLMRGSFAEMEQMAAPPGKERLRTIIVGFPNCAGPEGIAMLDRVYHRHKYYTLFRFRMIAFFHPDCDVKGLWNTDFRPMRSPMPVLAVRYLIEQDAAFAAKHRILLAPYLLRFGLPGARRIAAHRTRATRPDVTAES